MRKTLLVLRHELGTTLRRPAYLILAFGVPLLAVVAVFALKWLPSGSAGSENIATVSSGPFYMTVEGYVDESGLVRAVPLDFPPDHLLAYASEAEAQQALATGQITAYYVVPADYLERGEIDYVYPDSRALIKDGQDWVMARTLLFNLLGGDREAMDRVWNPIRRLDTESLAPQPQPGAAAGDCPRPGFACESNVLIRYLPLFMVALFYVSFMASSSLLFNSLGREKEDRALEIVLLSVQPRQLLAGKILGLGIAGLLQTAAWVTAIFILFRIGGNTPSLPPGFSLPSGFLVWSLVFFLGGYAVYASLMAGAGALVPRLKEAGGANFIAMAPLMVGYLIGLMASLTGTTHEGLSLGLSLFPLTAPVVMVMRLTEGVVPAWQVWLSAGLTFATAWLIFRAVAALFTAQTLLSGRPFSLMRYLKALIAVPASHPG
jgi:ABC-2 type transport system permease protein